jgi:uncharacterized protein
VRTLVWRRLDEPGMEIVRFDGPDRAEGTQIGSAYELRWRLDGSSLELEAVGGRREKVELGDADFFDVLNSPYFNSLPVWRDDLLAAAVARDYTMRFVAVPDLGTSLSAQQYEPLDAHTIRFRSASFEADIEFDADGFVTLYHGYLERIT